MKTIILIFLMFTLLDLNSSTSEVKLIPNKETVISKIIDADIYQKEKLCIVDGLTGELIVFDYKSGKQLNSFSLDFKLTDEISIQMKKIKPETKWVTLSELFHYKNDEMTVDKVNSLKKWIRHSFYKATFSSKNEIVAAGTIATNSVEGVGDSKWGLANIVCFFRINLIKNTIDIASISTIIANESAYFIYFNIFEYDKLKNELYINVSKKNGVDEVSVVKLDKGFNFRKNVGLKAKGEQGKIIEKYKQGEFLISSDSDNFTLYQYNPFIFKNGKQGEKLDYLEDCDFFNKIAENNNYLNETNPPCNFHIFDTDLKIVNNCFNILYSASNENKLMFSKYNLNGKKISDKVIPKDFKYDLIELFKINNDNSDIVLFYKLDDEYFIKVYEN